MSAPSVRMLSAPYYPRSFTILVIAAMGVLIVPLASGLINAVHVLQAVLDTQRQFTRDSLAVTRDVRQVVDSVSQLQRAAGQYHLLQDKEFGPALHARFDALQKQLADLEPRLTDPLARTTLATLRTRGLALYRTLRPGRFLDSERFHALDPAFDDLHVGAENLLHEADTAVQGELQVLEATVQATQQRLIALGLALIPLTLLLAAVFSWLINRRSSSSRPRSSSSARPISARCRRSAVRRTSSNSGARWTGCVSVCRRSRSRNCSSCATSRTNSRRRSPPCAKASPCLATNWPAASIRASARS
ncbi:MAG: hypothetical protein ACYC5S_01555 [Thiobacillus sp.]